LLPRLPVPLGYVGYGYGCCPRCGLGRYGLFTFTFTRLLGCATFCVHTVARCCVYARVYVVTFTLRYVVDYVATFTVTLYVAGYVVVTRCVVGFVIWLALVLLIVRC